jgi:hypothetical protein
MVLAQETVDHASCRAASFPTDLVSSITLAPVPKKLHPFEEVWTPDPNGLPITRKMRVLTWDREASSLTPDLRSARAVLTFYLARILHPIPLVGYQD